MKKILLFAAIAAVAACAEPETPAEPDATEEAAVEAPANIAADGMPTVGMYKVTLADGSVIMSDVREDGTYVITDADGNQVDTGTWEQKSPELYCETSAEEGSSQKCYEESVDENGVYTSKDPETGDVATVERIVEEAAAE